MQDSEPSNCSAKAQSPLPKNLYSCAPAVIETVMVPRLRRCRHEVGSVVPTVERACRDTE